MDRITALYQQFDPLRPLPATETDLYVDWQREMMESDDVKRRLVKSISRSGGAPVARLFTGHRGTGKTTELYRVKQMLEEGAVGRPRVFVSFLECEPWMDLNDVGPQDLILQMVRQLVEDLKVAGYGFGWDKIRHFFAEIGEILKTDVQLKDLNIEAGPLEIGMAIKDVPGARAALRRLLEDRLPRIYDLVNGEIIKPAREYLREKHNYSDLLIIVDQLDRIPQKQLNEQGLTNHEQLFLNSSGVLRALQCDVLYTIPIELAYSYCHGRLVDVYGGEILTLPMIDVTNPKGLEMMRDIALRRIRAGGVDAGEMFSPEDQLDRLCRLSGGHPRSLFALIRAALDRTDHLPLTEPVITRSIRMQASDFGKSLSAEQWDALKRVHENRQGLQADAERQQWMTFLRERYVYAYYDVEKGPWYDWNPLLEEARR